MKYKLAIITLLVLFFSVSLTTFASTDKKAIQERVAAMTAEQKEARAAEIKARVHEIQEMDKSKLSGGARRMLRQELRDMNTEAKAIDNGGIYISLAGVLLIILVLIIIL